MAPMMPRNTFLLVIGCQKGGTAWLFHYLGKHPQVATGFAKEFHVLDTHFLPAVRAHRDQRIAARQSQLDDLRATDEAGNAELIRRLSSGIAVHQRSRAMAEDLRNYAAYFTGLAAERDGVRLVCDVTPSYAALDAEHWREVRGLLEKANFDVRIFFLLRDPVERSYSAYRMRSKWVAQVQAGLIAGHPAKMLRARVGRGIRMTTARLRQSFARSPAALAAEDPFLQFALNKLNLRFSRYDETIESIEAVFPPGAIHYAFFEAFFREEALRRFCDFAGLDFMPGEYAVKQNATARDAGLAPFQADSLRQTLADTYAYCADRFGEDFIRGVWRHY